MPFHLFSITATKVKLLRQTHAGRAKSNLPQTPYRERGSWMCGCVLFTFHNVDQRAHVALLDDAAVLAILHRVHAVHDLLDL